MSPFSSTPPFFAHIGASHVVYMCLRPGPQLETLNNVPNRSFDHVCSLSTDDKLNLFTVTYLSVSFGSPGPFSRPLSVCIYIPITTGRTAPRLRFILLVSRPCPSQHLLLDLRPRFVFGIKSRTSVPPRPALQPSSPLPHFHFYHVNPPSPLRSMLTSSHWHRLLLCAPRCFQTARRSSSSPPSFVSVPLGAASAQVNVPLQRSCSRLTLGVGSPTRRGG